MAEQTRQSTRRADTRAKRAAFAATVAKALSHPLRGELLAALAEQGKASPSQLAGAVGRGLSLSAISYHVQQLRSLGLLRPAGTRQRRGAVEHFYELTSKGERVLGFLDIVGDSAASTGRSR